MEKLISEMKHFAQFNYFSYFLFFQILTNASKLLNKIYYLLS